MTREVPQEIESTQFDVAVVGAGVNGAGVARDAAMRGLRVLLLDKGDVGAGTTAWSTRLIHGGLRYLEHGEVGLVRESLRERERLLRLAPHLVRPLPLLIPLYAGARRGPLTVRAGMLAYDLLSPDKTLPRHRMLSREEALRRAPALEPHGLRGAALYYDAQVEFPERLALENALSARAHGATVLTYGRVRRLLVEAGAARGVEFEDLLGGGTRAARARVVVNVAGPWVDEVLRGADGLAPRRLIGGTKGSHVVVEPFAGAPPVALYAEAREDGRPFFVIPWNGRYLVGTTDTRFAGDLDHVTADEREVEYLLREANRLLPGARLTREAVLYTYAGVRPLPFDGARSEAAVTRRHFAHDHAPGVRGLFSVVGGKLTTYRSLAEQTVNLVFRQLGRPAPRCATAREPLPGGADFEEFAARFKRTSALPPAARERLLRIYGARAAEVEKLSLEDERLGETFSASTGAIAAEVVFAFRHEAAETLADCLWRRTMVALGGACLGAEDAERAALVARTHLGWSETRAARELAEYRSYVERFQTRAPTPA